MKLYLLRPVNDQAGAWDPWYDKAFGFVVRAVNEPAARALACEEYGDEGEAVWLDPSQTTCEELTADGPQEIVLRDFHSA
jgi:hypothetical protein